MPVFFTGTVPVVNVARSVSFVYYHYRCKNKNKIKNMPTDAFICGFADYRCNGNNNKNTGFYGPVVLQCIMQIKYCSI
jgi:hypothetical protein